jgi:type II secretory pathway pseudopilin PulG
MKNSMRRDDVEMQSNRVARLERAFTMVELLVVLFIMMLLTVVASTSLSRLMKTSRVEQAAQIVMTALWQTSGEAQRQKVHVSLFYGDDPSKISPQPVFFHCANVGKMNGNNFSWAPTTTPASLPPPGQMEMWVVLDGGEALGSGRGPYAPGIPMDDYNYGWYPFR